MLKGGDVVVPELPEGLLPATVEWWQGWVDSPQAEFFAATDWQALLRAAMLTELFYTSPSAQLAAEIRQIESKLGGTAADRDRLGWSTERPQAEEQPEAGSRGRRRDPREAAT